MARLVRQAGRYYLVGDNVYKDITPIIESEIKRRVEMEKLLLEYNFDISSNLHAKLANTKAQLVTAKKHLSLLLLKSSEVFDLWATTGNPHGAMLSLRPYLSIIKKWLEDSTKEED